MIGKAASNSRGFAATAEYLKHGTKKVDMAERVDWIASRNLPGNDLDGNALVMQVTADQNERVEQALYHLKVSFAPEDFPTRDEMELAADRLLKDLKLEDHQVLIVAHKDTPHRHMHLVVNRVHPETLKGWSRYQDWPKIERSLRGLEQELGFRLTPGRLHREPGVKLEQVETPRSWEVQRYRNTGQRPFAEVLKEDGVGQVMKAAMSWEDLETRLSERGLRLQKVGRGLQVTDGHQVAKASALDRGSSLGRLESRFKVSYGEHQAQQGGAQRPVEARSQIRSRPDPSTQKSSLSARDAPTEAVVEALEALEAWDRLQPQLRAVGQARDRLDRRGNVPELEADLARLETAAAEVPALEEVYRDPPRARQALEQSLEELGPVDTYRALRDQPEHFGPLQGRKWVGRPTQGRSEAQSSARHLGQRGLSEHVQAQQRRASLRQADVYRRRTLRIDGQRQALAGERGDREQLRAEVLIRFQGIEVEQLRPHLTASQFETMTQMAADVQRVLKPLRQAAGQLLELQEKSPDSPGLERELAEKIGRQVARLPRYMSRALRTGKLLAAGPAALPSLALNQVVRIALQIVKATPAQSLSRGRGMSL